MTAPARRRILVQLAHPLLEQSRITRRLAEVAAAVDGVTVNDLYEAYPTFDVDVRAEQARLLAHDVIVFQHPFFWYSVPALLKQWQDLVLEHGWAYGAGGLALRRKLTFNVVTTGGPAAAYQRTGYNRFTMRELLLPWEQTAHLCGMRYLAPYVIHGALRLADEAALAAHLDGYRGLLEALRDDRLHVRGARTAANLADAWPALVRTGAADEDDALDGGGGERELLR
ncbi:MAG TPA: NAD(P)H-dependent oxidoreductase [Kofleriaceae bacterium]|nr:NAD(P)H-dependent oxidoreductase [Kofleriaceae bacterium]